MLQYRLIQDFQEKIDALPEGHEFTLPSLMGEAWSRVHYGAAVGKAFKQAVQDGEIRLVAIKNTKANPAIYRRRAG